MEAVPKLPGLKFSPKECINVPVYTTALKKYIRNNFGEDPESYNAELQELEQLRSSICFTRHEYEYVSLLRRYFCQIRFLLSRFPLQDEDIGITYHWRNAYGRTVYEVPDVTHEQASVLYNIGVYHMRVGAAENRGTPEGMKIACTHFQCAAWAFDHVRTELPQGAEGDLSPVLMSFMHVVALAQAQECILEKSITDNRKPNIISKVAKQIAMYMETAQSNLESGRQTNLSLHELVGNSKYKSWGRHCELKQHYYTCVAQLYAGLTAEEQQSMGQRVAYYKDAIKYLELAEKTAKNVSDDDKSIRECLTFTNDVVGGKLTAALKENEFVYHEKVPDIERCPDLGGASLVKGIQFSFVDPEVCGTDIFKKLIPMETHQASSLYSEEKASVMRRIVEKAQEKQDELDAFMSSLQLEDVLLADNADTLPQELVAACAHLNSRDAITELNQAMAQVSGAHLAITQMLDDQKKIIEEEEKKAEEFFKMLREKKSPNIVLGDLKKEGEKCLTALTAANEKNMALHAAVAQHKPIITVLSGTLDQLTASLPSINKAMEQGGDAAAENKAQLHRLKGKVQEMEAQRAELLQKLRTAFDTDDITNQLIANKDQDLKQIFTENLKKHDPLLEVIEQNMLAQNNILTALSEANASFASTRKLTRQAAAAREHAMQNYLESYASFNSIMDKARDANEFYEKLTKQVDRLLKRTKGVITVQEEEREKKLSAQAKKFSYVKPDAKTSSVDSDEFSTHAYHTPLSTQDTTTSFPSSNTGGLKLKDFLQAGGGFKSLGSAAKVTAAAATGGYSGTQGYSQPSMPTTSYSAVPTYPNEGQPHVPQGAYTMQNYGPPNTRAQHMPAATGSMPPGHPINTSPAHQVPNPAVEGSNQAYAGYTPSAPPPAPSPAPSYTENQAMPTSTLAVQPPVPAAQYTASAAPQRMLSPGVNKTAAMQFPSPQITLTAAQGYQQPNPSMQHPYATRVPTVPTYATSAAGGYNSFGSTLPNNAMQHAQAMYYSNSPYTPNLFPSGTGVYTPSMSIAGGTMQGTMVSHTPSSKTPRSAPLTTNASEANYTSTVASNDANPTLVTRIAHPQMSTMVNGSPASQNPATTAGEDTPYYRYPSAALYPSYLYAQAGGVHVHSMTPASTRVPLASSGFSTPQQNTAPTATSASISQMPSYSIGAYAAGLSSGTAPIPSTVQGQQQALQSLYQQSNTASQPHFANYGQVPLGPANMHHVSQGAQPIPQGAQTAHPVSQGAHPIPQGAHSVSQGAHPVSQGAHPVSQGAHPVSQGAHPVSQGAYPVPQGAHSVSQGAYPVSQGAQPVSQGAYPIPQGAHPVPQGAHAVPQGMQPGQVPPPMGYQYPTQFGPSHMQQGPVSQPYPPKAMLPAPTSTLQPVTTAQQSAPAVATSSSTVSNLDLLSGIDLSGPSSQWMPLTPATSSVSTTKVNTASTAASPAPAVVAPPSTQATPADGVVGATSALASKPEALSPAPPAAVAVPPPVVTSVMPTIIDIAAITQSKSESPRCSAPVDPLDEPTILSSFISETERLNKMVEALDRRSLNGPTHLEVKWKEIQEAVEVTNKKATVSVGRCYPLKNRFPDILPYDHSRVLLTSNKDDYINASHVTLPGRHCFPVVLSQAPTPHSAADYWQMVWQLQTELVVCLHTLPEIKNAHYWPEGKEPVTHGSITIVVQSTSEGGSGAWKQRLLHLTNSASNGTSSNTRALIHLQFLAWPPGSGMPPTPSPLLQLCIEAVSLQHQQRNKQRPVLLSCISGVGRSGVTAILMMFINIMKNEGNICDLQQMCVNLCSSRRGGLQDKDYLRFLYASALYAAQDLLMKRGILTNKATFEEGPREKSKHVRHPSADLLTSSCDFNRLKSKLGFNSKEAVALTGSDDSTATPGPDEGEDAGDRDDVRDVPPPKSGSDSVLTGVTLPANLAASLDPQQLKLEPAPPGKGEKITKESFESRSSSGLSSARSNNPEDPFSSLDPLWTINKPSTSS